MGLSGHNHAGLSQFHQLRRETHRRWEVSFPGPVLGRIQYGKRAEQQHAFAALFLDLGCSVTPSSHFGDVPAIDCKPEPSAGQALSHRSLNTILSQGKNKAWSLG